MAVSAPEAARLYVANLTHAAAITLCDAIVRPTSITMTQKLITSGRQQPTFFGIGICDSPQVLSGHLSI